MRFIGRERRVSRAFREPDVLCCCAYLHLRRAAGLGVARTRMAPRRKSPRPRGSTSAMSGGRVSELARWPSSSCHWAADTFIWRPLHLSPAADRRGGAAFSCGAFSHLLSGKGLALEILHFARVANSWCVGGDVFSVEIVR